MNSAKLNDWMQVIGIFALVLSLVFVGIQLRQEQEIAIVDTYGAVTETEINISILVGENMAIWQRGLNGDDLSEEESGLFAGLVASIASHYQRIFIRWSRLGPGDQDLVASEFAYALYVFPGLRRAFEANRKFDGLRDEARGRENNLAPWEEKLLFYLGKFDEERPPIPDSKEYIFWAF